MIDKTNSFITLILLVFIVIIINVSTSNADDGDNGYFTSCGGFIKNNFKHNDNFIDYSKILVKLVSIRDGSVLERTDCSPIDGYFFLPIYEQGQYRIEIESPDSWVFDINSYTIADTSQCKNKDIDFELLGFKVEGTINNDQKCKIKQDKDNQNSVDFSSVKVELVKSKLDREYHGNNEVGSVEHPDDNKEEDIVIGVVNSEKDGNYKFISVVPISSGSEYRYKVRVVQPNWDFIKDEIPFQFQWNNYQITETFIVNGFDITGSVINDNLPVKGVVFSLYSKVLNTIKNCKPISNTIIKGFNSICSIESDEEGKFIFSKVPCTIGDEILKIIPQYVKDDVKYEIAPEEVDLIIDGSGSVIIDQVFQIRGFSISGIIVDEMGKAIVGVEIDIYINDEFKTKTDTDGIYILGEMKAGDYKIEAKKSNYKFKTLSKVTINPPNDMIIPDIQIESYQITGKFHLPKVLTSPFSNSIPSSKSSSFRSLGNNYHNRVKNTNNDNNDNNDNSPFFEFNKIELLLLQPLEEVDEDGNISLEFKLISTVKLNSNGEFEFDVVESGDYIVQIKSDQKQIKDHKVEFVKESLEVSVDSKPVTDLIFKQLTTRINGKIKTLYGQDNRIIPPDLSIELISTSTSTTEQFKPHSISENGEIEFKFEEILPGDYKVKIDFINWYWVTEEIEITAFEESLVIDPTTLTPIPFDIINMVEFDQTGFKFEIESPQSQQTGSIIVLHRFNSELIDSVPLTNGVNYLSLYQTGQHEFVIKSCFQFQEVHYTFETESSYYNGAYQIKLEIEKYLIEGSIDLSYLFKEYPFLKQPDSISIKVNILNSKGELIDQLDTSLESSTIYQYSFMHSIDDEEFELVPVINIHSDQMLKDSISIQPTSRFIKFNLNEQIGNCVPTIEPFIIIKKVEELEELEQELVNDKVNEVDIGSFGNIRVKLRDSKSDEPVGGAFLSLSTSTSSNNQFRVNVQIPLNGTFDFNLLEPNKYYLKSVLKDYTISPSSQVIEVHEGQEQIIHLVAKKILFSVSGVVCWLNSIPIPNILVQSFIVSDNPNLPLILFKEIKTNENGNFKLTGFTVGQSFQIKLSIANNASLSSTPNVKNLNFNDELDKSNINFIVVPSLSTISTEQIKLTGNILIDGKKQKINKGPTNNNEYNSLLPNDLKVVIYNSNGIFIKSLDISMFNTFSTVLTKSKSFNYIIKIEKDFSKTSLLDYGNSNGKSFIGFGNKIKNNLIDDQDHYHYQIIPNQIQIPIDCLSNYQASFKIQFKNNNGSFNMGPDLKTNENNLVSIPYSNLLFSVVVILSVLYPNKVYSFFKSLFTLDFIGKKHNQNQNQNQKN